MCVLYFMTLEAQNRFLCLFMERESISLSPLFLLLTAAQPCEGVASVGREGRYTCFSNDDLPPALHTCRTGWSGGGCREGGES